MTDPVSLSALSGTSNTQDRTALGKDEFMTLLLTQLQNQDPMSPLEPHEFAAQLADFTSVEQLAQLNDGMNMQLESQSLATALSKTSFSAALLGKSILALGNDIVIPERTNDGSITVDVGAAGGSGTLTVYDQDGKEVYSGDVGQLEGGRQSILLPDELESGTYSYKLDVEGVDGTKVPVTTYTMGTVDRVLFENGAIMLRMGGLDVVLESLVEIADQDQDQA